MIERSASSKETDPVLRMNVHDKNIWDSPE